LSAHASDATEGEREDLEQEITNLASQIGVDEVQEEGDHEDSEQELWSDIDPEEV
jgi:hypothetical protein